MLICGISSGTYYDSLYKKTTTYGQTYDYDNIGNMTKKTSWKKIQNISTNDSFNYTYNYEYDTAHPHRAIQIGGLKYKYDDNGNLLKKYTQLQPVNNGEEEDNTVNEPNSDDEAYGYNWDGTNTNEKVFEEYVWDEDNRLKKSTVNGRIAYYLYNAGGERTVKKEVSGNEVLYADKLYQVKVNMNKDCITRHIFVGDTRIVSSVTFSNLTHDDTVYKQGNYFYHSDHLGSSNFISDYQGNEYEHIEYAPYGETWIEESKDSNDYINFMYTGKMLDDETGLYYFGQRFYDQKTSRWMSTDPVLEDYLVGIVSKKNTNPINFSLYSYCGNNPLIYVDPDGKKKSGIEYWLFRIFMGKENADKLCGDWRCDGAQELADKMLDVEASFIPGVDAVQDVKSFMTGKTLNGEETSRLLAAVSILIPISLGPLGKKTIKELAEINIKNTGKTVLGHHKTIGGYIDKAKKMNASYFDIGDAWDYLDDTQKLAANRHFLDVVADKGDDIFLSVEKKNIKAGSWLSKEIDYLTNEKGYKWVNQWKLSKGSK